MSFTKVVKNKDGNNVTVIGTDEKEFNEAVKSVQNDAAPVYPNINHPVQKGHDLVAVGSDVSKVLVDGEGAHNSPNDAIDENGKESGDKNITAAGLEEPAYKSVPVYGNEQVEPRFATDAEVKKAQADSEPANEIEPQGAKDKTSKK